MSNSRFNAMSSPISGIPSRLKLLLFSEVCLLSSIAGILTLRMPDAGLCMLLLIWLLDFPRTRTVIHSLMLVVFFCGAFAYASWRSPSAPPVPEWLQTSAFAVENAKGETKPPPALSIQGTVERCTPLQANRVRIILSEVRPASAASYEDSPRDAPYSGKIVWTWRAPNFFPVPGQKITAKVRLAPVRSFKNPGTWDLEAYWREKGVWFRAWGGSATLTKDIDLEKNPGGYFQILLTYLAQIRQNLERRFTANLPYIPDKDAESGIPTSGAAILPALVFGNRSLISLEQTDMIARATLAHTLALSGLHLGFAVLVGTALATGVGYLYPQLWLRISRPQAALALSLPLACLYIWLGQSPMSLLRAACMLTFWTLMAFCRRPRVFLDGLFAALAFLLFINPLALFDLSLQLSAVSVAALALGLPYIQQVALFLVPVTRQQNSRSRFVRQWLRGAIALAGTSLCIQILLLPFIARVFGVAGWLFPLNILWLPVLGLVVLPLAFFGLLCTAGGFDPLACIFLSGAALPCEALMNLLSRLDAAGLLFSHLLPRPHWLTCAGFWLTCLYLPGTASALMRKPTYQCIGGSIACLVGTLLFFLPIAHAWQENRQTAVNVSLLDVGQGQSVLIEWRGLEGEQPHGRVLVDGGGFSSPAFDVGQAIVAPALTDNSLPRLTYILASHSDSDHLGGIVFLLKHFSFSGYFSNGDTPAGLLAVKERRALQKSGGLKKTLKAGDRIPLGQDLFLETLWPSAPHLPALLTRTSRQESGNNASLILRLVWQDRPLALLCGDVEGPALATALGLFPEQFRAEALVLPHHGAASSLVQGFYEAVQPRVALASCGFQNRWGFPSRAVRNALQSRSIPLYSTAASGQIRISWCQPDAEPTVTFSREESLLPGK